MSKGSAFSTAMTVINEGKEYANSLGMITDEMIVTIRGNKLASKSRLYKMAAALAFGQIQRMDSNTGRGVMPCPGLIMMENHLHDVCVTFTLRYTRSLATIMAVQSLNYIGTAIGGGASVTVSQFLSRLPVFTGPDNDYSGGYWDFSNLLLSGVEFDLPYSGKPILFQSSHSPDPNPNTGKSGISDFVSQNPRPMGDARSRGTLVSLVTAALSNPGSTAGLTMPVNPNNTLATFYGGP